MKYNFNSSIFFYCFFAICVASCSWIDATHSPLKTAKQVGQSPLEDCTVVKDPEGWSVPIWRPGNYCIVQNLKQSWPLIRFPHQRLPRSPLISIYSDNIFLDLKGHHLSSTTPILTGIYKIVSSSENNLPITITNGKITTAEKPTIFMVEDWNLNNLRFGRSYSLASSEGDMSKYRPTMFILENLTIKSEKHAIIIQGKSNSIRNCIIIGGNGTVNIYGPNLTFEGNTIISNFTEPKSATDEQPVALHLEDAANSIVRNNRILIKGSKVFNSTAMVLANSPNVLIENNIVRDASDIYKLKDDRSSVRAIGNDSK